MSWNLRFDLWVERFLVPIDDPGSRLFHLNVVIAAVLALVWLRQTDGEWKWSRVRALFFDKDYWWNSSTKTDYLLYFLNSLLKVFLFLPFLDLSFEISRGVSEGLLLAFGDFRDFEASQGILVIFTFAVFVWDDFLRFLQHLLMHRVPFLWRLHSVHHSATTLTPVTLFRNHPMESAIATLRNSLSLGVATGVFVFLFQAQLNVVTLFGVNAFGFMFNFLGSNLRHSHVPLAFPQWVETFFISPKQHQIHHSAAPEHRDRNLGVSLAVWDRLMGTLVSSRQVRQEVSLRFGLND